MRFRFIEGHQHEFSVAAMCRVLEVSRAGFYTYQRRPESRRSREDRRLLVEIRAAHRSSRGCYGSPRIHQDLRERGLRVGKKRVARLMRFHGLRAHQRRRFRVTTNSCHSLAIAPNLLNRRFDVDQKDRVWSADLTYIATGEGWLYLAVVLDLFSRRVVGWATSDRITESLASRALEAAIAQRQPRGGLVHHSDRGIQYASQAYQERLESRQMIVSMSRRGDCWDNAVVESFISSLKLEAFAGRLPATRAQAQALLFEYIEVFYNRQRRHSSIGYQSPQQFEQSQGRAQ